MNDAPEPSAWCCNCSRYMHMSEVNSVAWNAECPDCGAKVQVYAG